MNISTEIGVAEYYTKTVILTDYKETSFTIYRYTDSHPMWDGISTE